MNNRKGFAILTVVFIMVIFSILGIAAVSLITGSGQMMQDEYSSAQAFHLAEAGIDYMAKELSQDNNWTDNIAVTKNFGSGSFTVTFLLQTSNTATIKSTGTVNGIGHSITQELSKGGTPVALDSALYTEQNIAVSGQGLVTCNGNAVAGNRVNGSGQGHVDINGDLATGNGVGTSGQARVDVTGSSTTGYLTASVPTPNWTYWQSGATIHEGNWTFSGQGSSTFSGVHYVTGNFSMSGQKNVTINGTLVVLGSVSQSGQGVLNVNPTLPNPAIIAGGNVTLSGQSQTSASYGGYIYSNGSVSLSGQGGMNVSGGVIGRSGITLSGQGAVNVTHGAGMNPSGFVGGEGTGGIEFGAWRETF